MKILEMNEKVDNQERCTYKITPISVTNCPSVPNLTSNGCNETGLSYNGSICRLSYLHMHEF